ncbi:MAG: oxidoreductase [Aggregatilineales bacterium]
MARYRRVAQLKTPDVFRAYLASIEADLPFDDALETGPGAPLAQPLQIGPFTVGNRFCVLPMEGWDGTRDGRPSRLTLRRWRRFGAGGAKLIWGGEAVAVRHDGRANPNQLVIHADTVDDLAALRAALVAAHVEHHGSAADLLIGLQLTHSGRYSRPDGPPAPRALYRHPLLDRHVGIADDSALLIDSDIRALIGDFARAAALAQRAGFDFVDLKHCHGYLGHEFLSAVDRPGLYGGSFENRTRFLRETVDAVRAAAPGLLIGVRFSAFDWLPFRPGSDGTGEPEPFKGDYRYAFGGDASGTGIDLAEPLRFVDLLAELDIPLVCVTAGSPYYNPHIQRPALFPPSDGYQPPEDPLCGVARQLRVTAALKRRQPGLAFVASGLTYLQEWLPHAAQRMVRAGWADFAGLGRMALAYPDLPADALAGRPLQRKLLCRTFSDCTTAPRNGLVSGCYPLDDFYAQRPEATALAAAKQKAKQP